MNKLIILVLSLAVLFSGWQFVQKLKGAPTTMTNSYSTDEAAQNENTSSSPAEVQGETSTGPNPMTIDTNKTYTAVLTTDKGEMTISLNAKQTPITVNNFVTLARKGFYDGTIFHRTIDGFMIQGGDPEGTGRGGPGYRFDDEAFEGEYTRGTVAMANAGPDTNGSQFFIMHADYALPKNYVIFGKVTKGLEVVDAIATAPVKMSDSGEESAPVTPVKVTKVEIVEQ